MTVRGQRELQALPLPSIPALIREAPVKDAAHDPIERLNEEFRRRVKTQGALPTEDAALVLLFGLVAAGQIRFRRLDGWRQIPAPLRQRRQPAACRVALGSRIALEGRTYTGGYPRNLVFLEVKSRAMLSHLDFDLGLY